ncbi:glycosyltransferase family 2 protein [Cellulomonas phragmiteti]|uniref:Glycosyl transferase n=1 Tax=Cellulomonas phragmiteti TaxID=478780 RepID=A0ABQ4DJV7_9CELL|nr:glycosyltransferase family 2 protein [Cellulomonas phragmiteti]GIG39631.1 glycosyl transferase [Cellulomonas phragmiteti]
MKVFIQIPCLNEETTLPAVLRSVPRTIEGVETEILVIDDGSTDRTVEVARAHGVRHFVRHTRNMGLARSFRDGVHYALTHGADIVVNTDGDNQYPQERIPDLVAPILAGEADIVIADRQTATIAEFSAFKKLMQRVGSAVVNGAADTDLPDAASGFRAYSRSALIRLNVVTEFSYCMETIIQAGHKRLKIASIPVTTNAKTRESRLFTSITQHMSRSAAAIIRSYLMFKPQAVFATLTALFGTLALVPMVRFLVLWAVEGNGDGNVQSLIFGAIMAVAALLSLALGVLSELQRTNRILLEEQLERIKEMQYRGALRVTPSWESWSTEVARATEQPTDRA